MTSEALWNMGMESVKALESEFGVLASARTEAYGCIFGRDSALTTLALLHAYTKSSDPYLLALVERSLRTLANLQGRFENIESGEAPGKIIHEYRPNKHEHLTQLAEDPWYLYPEGEMRNYDSVDATPLFLIAVHEYAKVGDKHFINTLMPAVRAGLNWLCSFDGFITYDFPMTRTFGGLRVQSWMDSTESLFYEHSSERPPYPIAPVEVQAYAYSALVRWGESAKAARLRELFTIAFVMADAEQVALAFAIDGKGKRLESARSNMGHVLWAAVAGESILDTLYIAPLVRRLMQPDLFVEGAGLRTLSSNSTHFDPQSYHNGSIWPHDTAMVAEGFQNFGFDKEAQLLRDALVTAYSYFKTPVELYTYEDELKPYEPMSGHRACQIQAWSAASLLAILGDAIPNASAPQPART
ncbi:MAG TPA: hypothetical protein VIY48_08065 [Candidatus Paceibacterota bacterium]